MGVRVTVLVVLATIHLGTTEESAGKKSYLNVIQKLYQSIGASDEELQLMILKSLAADYINSGIPLRLHKSIRDLQLEEWTSSGHFKALILLQSHDGVSFRILGGTLNMSNLRLSISLDELRDPTEYVSSLPTYKKNQSPSINNGSNGTEYISCLYMTLLHHTHTYMQGTHKNAMCAHPLPCTPFYPF